MRGLQEARGQFVAFVDSDDWVELDMFEGLYRAAILAGSHIAECGGGDVRDGRFDEREPDEWKQASTDAFGVITLPSRAAIYGMPTIWRRIYNTDFLRDKNIVFPVQFRRFDDLPFQFHVLMRDEKVAIYPRTGYNYRVGRDGQDVSVDDDRLHIHFPILEYMRNIVLEQGNRKLLKVFLAIQLATHFWGLEKIRVAMKPAYARKMARDLFDQPLGLNSLNLLWRFIRLRPQSRWLLMRLWLTSRFAGRSGGDAT